MTTAAPLAALLLAAGLAACAAAPAPASDGFAGAARACMVANPGFTDAWACIRKRITREDTGAEDPDRTTLKALGDDLTRQLAAETLTSPEARARLLAGLPPPARP